MSTVSQYSSLVARILSLSSEQGEAVPDIRDAKVCELRQPAWEFTVLAK